MCYNLLPKNNQRLATALTMEVQMVKNIREQDWKHEVLDSKTPVIVDLWAPWCQPCKGIAKELDEVSKTYGNRVKIVKVNVDESPSLVGSLQIKSVPTLLFYSARSHAPLSIVGATTARSIVSRFRLDELPVHA